MRGVIGTGDEDSQNSGLGTTTSPLRVMQQRTSVLVSPAMIAKCENRGAALRVTDTTDKATYEYCPTVGARIDRFLSR